VESRTATEPLGDRRQGGELRTSPLDAGDDRVLQSGAAAEQHLALVGEVAKERPLGDAGAFSDRGDCRLLVAELGEQRERRLFGSSAAIGLPSNHDPIVVDVRT
jgi:hypothetical protein